ncbi:hypothetical protein ACMWV9_001692 [Acinetobacter baumannii]|nr:hypothetical protein [Acinetobacter baumannii]EJX0976681.1 hypothetical protein [Acinetobacter baumannii]EKD2867574.1 hypothetical protein [Acinetobacter baumannii]EKV2605126.1 hypothetical protein [Acinetobacter baumannii]EKV2612387.1 hypothetical protein [Acinetobacter baumannii]
MDSAFFTPNSKSMVMGKNSKVNTYEPPHQRVWNEIRQRSEGFTLLEVAEAGSMRINSARAFIDGLKAAGFLSVISEKPTRYRLERDSGYTPPEIRRDGSFVKPKNSELIEKAMWNTLRITRAAVNAHELAALSSNDELTVPTHVSEEYLVMLWCAGYVSKLGTKTDKKTKYQLLPDMNTGSKPPTIRSIHQVVDQNTNELMFQGSHVFEQELKHGSLLKQGLKK